MSKRARSKTVTIDSSAINQRDIRQSKALLVCWRDSTSTGRWRKEMTGNPCALCVSIGFFLYEDKKSLVLAMSLGDNGEFTDTLAIPKACIEERRKVPDLRRKPTGKKKRKARP